MVIAAAAFLVFAFRIVSNVSHRVDNRQSIAQGEGRSYEGASTGSRALTQGEPGYGSQTSPDGSKFSWRSLYGGARAQGAGSRQGPRYVQGPEEGFSFMGMFKDVGKLLKMAVGGGEFKDYGSFEGKDKKELWKKYGHLFGSKEEGKEAYKEYHEKRKKMGKR